MRILDDMSCASFVTEAKADAQDLGDLFILVQVRRQSPGVGAAATYQLNSPSALGRLGERLLGQIDDLLSDTCCEFFDDDRDAETEAP